MSKSKAEADKDLSLALEQTFPASDAFSIDDVDVRPVRPVGRMPAAIDKSLVDRMARDVKRWHGQGG